MNNIEVISILPLNDSGALQAFVEIKVGGLVISNCKIIQENGKKPWISMPAISYKNQQGTVCYKTLVKVLDKNLKNAISQTILHAWEKDYRKENGYRKNS